MARRKTPSRVELRRAAEAAEKIEAEEGAPVKKKAATKKKATRRSTKKKVAVTRMRVAWGVFDNSNQQVATFPFDQKEAAEAKVEELANKPRGPYFVQRIKEAIPEVVPEEA